jgi:hypothetical protein
MSLLAFWREATTVVAGRMQSLPLAPPTAGLSAQRPLAFPNSVGFYAIAAKVGDESNASDAACCTKVCDHESGENLQQLRGF